MCIFASNTFAYIISIFALNSKMVITISYWYSLGLGSWKPQGIPILQIGSHWSCEVNGLVEGVAIRRPSGSMESSEWQWRHIEYSRDLHNGMDSFKMARTNSAKTFQMTPTKSFRDAVKSFKLETDITDSFRMPQTDHESCEVSHHLSSCGENPCPLDELTTERVEDPSTRKPSIRDFPPPREYWDPIYWSQVHGLDAPGPGQQGHWPTGQIPACIRTWDVFTHLSGVGSSSGGSW